MPCFARQIRRLKVKMPEKVSLFEDAEEIEKRLKQKLKAESHEELHQKTEQMDKAQLKEILEEILEDLEAEKQEDKSPPDRLKKLKEQGDKVWKAVA